MKGVKAFNKGLVCRDYQFEENKEHTTDEKIIPCESGFHFCKEDQALSVLNYYSPLSEFHSVEATGETVEYEDKVVTNKLKIHGKLTLAKLFELQFKFIREVCSKSINANTSGYRAHANTSGDEAHANTSGHRAHANTSGYRAHANTSGDEAHANTSGDEAHANTSGHRAHANTSGDRAHANTSGHRAHANTSGYRAHANTSGDEAHANTSGDESISSSIGIHSKAKAEKGWIVITDWRYNDGWKIENIYSAKVGGEILGVVIEPNTWYWFEEGQLQTEKV